MTISIRLGAGAVDGAGSSTTTAGTNPAGTDPTSVPARYALRQANSSELDIPWRRAVAEAWRQPAKLSSTLLRLRRPTTSPAEFDHLELLNLRTISMPIHKDSAHRPVRYRKAAFTGGLQHTGNCTIIK